METMNSVELGETLGRLTAAAEALEQAVERLTQRQVAIAAEAQETAERAGDQDIERDVQRDVQLGVERIVDRIVGTVESARETELARRLEEAEARIAQLSAAAASPAGRKTLSAGTASMLAKQGLSLDSLDAAAIDGALNGLSIEQRIAVKAELMRAGVL